MPTYITIDQSQRIVSLLNNLEAKLAAILQASISPTSQPLQSSPSPPTNPPTQPKSLAKKKRNQRTRQQHKKAKAQAQRVTTMQVQEADYIQEVEHAYGQEVEHLDVQISVVKASKHEAMAKSFVNSVTWNWIPTVATSWHAVIRCFGMTSFVGMIMNGVIYMRRMGVG